MEILKGMNVKTNKRAGALLHWPFLFVRALFNRAYNARLRADGDTSWRIYILTFTAQRRVDNKPVALTGDCACRTHCLAGITGKACVPYLQGHQIRP